MASFSFTSYRAKLTVEDGVEGPDGGAGQPSRCRVVRVERKRTKRAGDKEGWVVNGPRKKRERITDGSSVDASADAVGSEQRSKEVLVNE